MASLTAGSRKALNDSWAQQSAMQSAQQAFQQALDEKFGRGGKILSSPADDITTALSRLGGAEVLETTGAPGGSARLRVKTSLKGSDGKTISREEMLLARKEGGDWKLVIGFPATRDSKAAFDRLTKEVKAGEFKDRNSAMIALDKETSEANEKKGAPK